MRHIMSKIVLNVKSRKNNQPSFSDAYREIPTLGSMDNTGNSFPALSFYPQVGISRSASETNDRFYLSQCSKIK